MVLRPKTDSMMPSGRSRGSQYCQHDMQFYDDCATDFINVKTLARLSFDRMKILNIVLQLAAKNEEKTPNERRKQFVDELRKKGFKDFAELCDGKGCEINTKERKEARRNDNVMHNMLCLTFRRDKKILEWLMKAESLLFRWRLEALNDEGIAAFRAINNMHYERIGDNEKECLKDDLIETIDDPSAFAETPFYKVPALELLEEIKYHGTYFEKGQAYINESKFISLINRHFLQRFSTRVQKSILLDYFDPKDKTIEKLVANLRKMYEELQPRSSFDPEVITADKLEELSKTYYPPCMRNIHEGLKRDHHLRNGGRLQYTFFLKAIGVPAEEGLKFYREKFSEKFDDDTFNKEFLYQFRHMYGLVGAKKHYEPLDCVAMASKTRTHEFDHHGCFFAPPDIEDFGKKLIDWNIPTKYRDEIYYAKKNQEYGKACCLYFKASHKRPPTADIVNPIDFYKNSKTVPSINIQNGNPEDEASEEDDIQGE